MMISVTTKPAEPLLDIELVKANLRVQHSEEDALITAQIAAVESYLDGPEGIMRRALIDQEWTIEAKDFASAAVALGGVKSIVSVSYYPADGGALIAMPSAGYSLERHTLGARVRPINEPSLADRSDAVRVVYAAGYGAARDDVPAAIRQAGRLLAGHYYNHRDAVITGARPNELPLGVYGLLSPFRFLRV